LRHAFTNAVTASWALPAGTMGFVVVGGAVVVVDVVVVAALEDEAAALGVESLEHATSAHTATRGAAMDTKRLGISPT
jgi:hypothetical protein